MRVAFLTSCVAVVLTTAALAQMPGDMPPNAEPGKCYAKCLIEKPYAVDTVYEEYPIYIGDEDVPMNRIRRLAGRNEDGSERYLELQVPRRVNRLPEEDVVYEQYAVLEEQTASSFTEWREIVCGSDVTPLLLNDIWWALRERGYDPGPQDAMMNKRIKQALIAFQRSVDLPIGQIDFETLDALGIRI